MMEYNLYRVHYEIGWLFPRERVAYVIACSVGQANFLAYKNSKHKDSYKLINCTLNDFTFKGVLSDNKIKKAM